VILWLAAWIGLFIVRIVSWIEWALVPRSIAGRLSDPAQACEKNVHLLQLSDWQPRSKNGITD
jgi:hypothetical protein